MEAKGTPRSFQSKAGFLPGDFRSSNPEDFIESRNKSKRPGFLSPLAPADLRDHKLLMNKEGTVGVAIDPQGDIQNVFNNGGAKGEAAPRRSPRDKTKAERLWMRSMISCPNTIVSLGFQEDRQNEVQS